MTSKDEKREEEEQRDLPKLCTQLKGICRNRGDQIIRQDERIQFRKLANKQNTFQFVVIQQQTFQIVHFHECNFRKHTNTIVTQIQKNNIFQKKNTTNTFSRQLIITKINISQCLEFIKTLITKGHNIFIHEQTSVCCTIGQFDSAHPDTGEEPSS